MNFFCTKKHWDDWTKEMNLNSEEIFCLDAYEGLAVAKMLFSIK